MKKTRQRRVGIALVLVLVTVVVTSVLGMSYISVTSVRLAGSTNLVRAARARYLAESGLHHALYLLRTGSAQLSGHDADNPVGPFYADDTDDAYVFWTQQDGPDPLVYAVTARGTTGGLTRTSQLHVQLYNTYRSDLEALGPLSYWRLGEPADDNARDWMHVNDGKYRRGTQQGQGGALVGDLDGAAHFDGVDDHVDLKEMDVAGWEATFIVWFKADDFAVSDARLISKADGLQTSDHYWMLSTCQSGSDIRLRFRLKCQGSTEVLVATGAGKVHPGEWTMAAGTFNGFWMKLYKNGKPAGQQPKFGWIDQDDHVEAWIGGSPTGDTDRPFHGTIDEVAIFQKTISEDELKALYEARTARLRILSWDM